MGRYKQPDPITESWEVYRKMVKIHIETHRMSGYPNSKCKTHKDCHLKSFYPGKLYRAMRLKKNKDGILVLEKSKNAELSLSVYPSNNDSNNFKQPPT